MPGYLALASSSASIRRSKRPRRPRLWSCRSGRGGEEALLLRLGIEALEIAEGHVLPIVVQPEAARAPARTAVGDEVRDQERPPISLLPRLDGPRNDPRSCLVQSGGDVSHVANVLAKQGSGQGRAARALEPIEERKNPAGTQEKRLGAK